MKKLEEYVLEIEKNKVQITNIETSLTSFSNVKDLFEKVLVQLEEELFIPFVWISIINRQAMNGLIKTLATSKIVKERLNIIDESIFFNLIPNGTKPVLVNEDLKPFFKLLPKNKKKFYIRSLAVAPITLHEEIIGSINHGDFSGLRYQPDMDTGLLQELTSRFSSRLSEIISSEKAADAPKEEAE